MFVLSAGFHIVYTWSANFYLNNGLLGKLTESKSVVCLCRTEIIAVSSVQLIGYSE